MRNRCYTKALNIMSNRCNAMEENFELVTVFDKPMLFTCIRIDRNSVAEGLYMYEVRHDDDQQGDPVEIANWIMVNHWGTLISSEPPALVPSTKINNAYLDINPKTDWSYEDGSFTVKEYMEKYPPKTSL